MTKIRWYGRRHRRALPPVRLHPAINATKRPLLSMGTIGRTSWDAWVRTRTFRIQSPTWTILDLLPGTIASHRKPQTSLVSVACRGWLHEWLHAESKESYALHVSRRVAQATLSYRECDRWRSKVGQSCPSCDRHWPLSLGGNRTDAGPRYRTESGRFARVPLQEFVDRSTNQTRASALVSTSQCIDLLDCGRREANPGHDHRYFRRAGGWAKIRSVDSATEQLGDVATAVEVGHQLISTHRPGVSVPSQSSSLHPLLDFLRGGRPCCEDRVTIDLARTFAQDDDHACGVS